MQNRTLLCKLSIPFPRLSASPVRSLQSMLLPLTAPSAPPARRREVDIVVLERVQKNAGRVHLPASRQIPGLCDRSKSKTVKIIVATHLQLQKIANNQHTLSRLCKTLALFRLVFVKLVKLYRTFGKYYF